jgi:ribokinase
VSGPAVVVRSVVVVGSVNTDYVLRVGRRPGAGETVGGATLEVHPGGKGANQAVAAARYGAAVALVARVGDDDLGERRRVELEAEGVGTANLLSTAGASSGLTVITVTPDGENSIVVVPGANAELSPGDVGAAEADLAAASVLVLGLEVPMATVVRAAELAGPQTAVLLNAAPAQPLPTELPARVGVLIVNEHEACELAGIPVGGAVDARRAAAVLRERGAGAVVVTLGALGAVLLDASGAVEHVPAPTVHVVDTTGAGDAFVGALASRIAAGATLLEGVEAGVAAGSATTQVVGALAQVPPTLRRLH